MGTSGGGARRRRVVWVSTAMTTRGGVATVVRAVSGTPLWSRWSVRHVVTHQDGSAQAKVLRFLRGAAHLWWLLLVRRPDLLHVHTSAGGSFVRKAVVAWSARAAGVPVVLHVHAGGFADFHDALRPWQQRVVRATLEGSAVVVALGPTWAARLRQIAPAADVRVVPNAVPEPAPAPAPAAPGPADGPLALFLGRLGEEKGVPLLLEAWPRVLERLPTGAAVRLVLAGDGEVERFAARVAEVGLPAVELPGWVSTRTVAGLLDRADVLVLPSTREGMPMAVLEAMSRGVPVVATAVGGIPDLVDETSGVLVPSGDADALVEALASVLGDATLRQRLGEGGRQRVRDHFSVDSTWRLVDEIYVELLGP